MKLYKEYLNVVTCNTPVFEELKCFRCQHIWELQTLKSRPVFGPPYTYT